MARHVRRVDWLICFFILLTLWMPAAFGQDDADNAPPTRGAWLEVEIGIIGTASEDILRSAIETVRRESHAGLVVLLDTPGGALENTRAMVKEIMAAPFPVVVWVGPSGSRAGSAGAFITLSAHVAAMAPGTNIGAAHPVDASGADVQDEMKRKVTNDTIAFIESVAKSRNRNVDMARSFVATSVSITAEEALEHNVIDLVADDVPALMAKIDGRKVQVLPNVAVTLATKDAPRVIYDKSFRERVLEILSNPNLFYLLFLAGLIGIGYELTHPGMLFPGVVGGICMLLAMIAMSILPVSYGAAALILLGIAMLVAEAFVTSYGILGIGGLIAFVLGSIFLVDPSNESGLRISLLAIAPGALTIALAFLGLGFLVLRAERSPVRAGREALIDKKAVALQDFGDGKGQVRCEGAIWSARVLGPETVQAGDELRVKAVEGLELHVTKWTES